MKKIIFNCSLPRSGSTLLQNILAQNPRFYASPTSAVLEMLIATRPTFTSHPHILAQEANLMKEAYKGFWEGAMQGWYGRITDRPICVDKSRGWTNFHEWLMEFDPQVKVLVCVRDLRAILASMEKLWRKNKHLADPTLNKDSHPLDMMTIPSRVKHWLNTPPVGVGVTVLINAIQTGVFRRLHIIPFEEFTTRPRETMQKVYQYLEEPMFEHDFQHVEQKTVENDSYFPIYGDHTIREKVQPVPLDYNEVLGKETCGLIKAGNPLFYSTLYPNSK